VPLPSLGNYDPMDANPTSEVFYLSPLSYDVAAFRFNVNSVFASPRRCRASTWAPRCRPTG
jgi:hypothetical protein